MNYSDLIVLPSTLAQRFEALDARRYDAFCFSWMRSKIAGGQCSSSETDPRLLAVMALEGEIAAYHFGFSADPCDWERHADACAMIADLASGLDKVN